MAKLSYAQRPAKYIQRRMVADALRRLRVFAPLSEYEYVGFGGLEFVDFELFHRELEVDEMTSIEEDSNSASRFRFNVPFSKVEVLFDKASAVLPNLLDRPRLRVVWLDYESELESEVLQDLGTAIRRLVPGSVLLITVNAKGPSRAAERLSRFEDDVGAERIPAGVDSSTLAKWGWAEASYRVIQAEALATVARRTDGASFEQLFRFHYADNARMLTWGGIVVAPAGKVAFESAGFDELAQVRRADAKPFEISPPVLTTREALHLNAQLPTENTAAIDTAGVNPAEVASYAELYRWYPPVPAAM
jgi:hypothetical protein